MLAKCLEDLVGSLVANVLPIVAVIHKLPQAKRHAAFSTPTFVDNKKEEQERAGLRDARHVWKMAAAAAA